MKKLAMALFALVFSFSAFAEEMPNNALGVWKIYPHEEFDGYWSNIVTINPKQIEIKDVNDNTVTHSGISQLSYVSGKQIIQSIENYYEIPDLRKDYPVGMRKYVYPLIKPNKFYVLVDTSSDKNYSEVEEYVILDDKNMLVYTDGMYGEVLPMPYKKQSKK